MTMELPLTTPVSGVAVPVMKVTLLPLIVPPIGQLPSIPALSDQKVVPPKLAPDWVISIVIVVVMLAQLLSG